MEAGSCMSACFFARKSPDGPSTLEPHSSQGMGYLGSCRISSSNCTGVKDMQTPMLCGV